MRKAEYLTTGDVARALGYSPTWVNRLDAELKPERTANGVRLYRADVVEEVRAKRAAKAAR